ncbi:hypothetical protein SKAU_G00081070 [Synaphobranchus kaupii]|uniref:Secreted protein n=1 Tax=Synaphobranchus kaupii TaxID=118154 RepID=A0A9Q1FUI7_SYNKA|nr:hypothetical protein SKAU_G00081070 [Synaphobranchus kaupii]
MAPSSRLILFFFVVLSILHAVTWETDSQLNMIKALAISLKFWLAGGQCRQRVTQSPGVEGKNNGCQRSTLQLQLRR